MREFKEFQCPSLARFSDIYILYYYSYHERCKECSELYYTFHFELYPVI